MRCCRMLSAALFFVVASATASSASSVKIERDDSGRAVLVAAPAARIISLAPSLTELAFAVGAGEKVVGVSAYSDTPAAAKTRPIIADAGGVNLEALLALKPDLVLAWKSGNRPQDIERIRGLNIPVYVVEIAKLSDVPRSLRDIGTLAQTSSVADSAAQKFEDDIARLRKAHASVKRVSVFFEISRQPLMTINANHVIDEIITLCGGVNVFRDLPVLVPQPSLEALFAKQPDVILYAAEATSNNAAPWERYRGLNAYAQKRVLRVAPDPILRAGPQLAQGARDVCAAIDEARRASKN
jgi:iron complex transport system substrate-binding protein